MSGLVSQLSASSIDTFGRGIVTGRHRLGEHPLFSDAALADLLDEFPREHLYAHDMGTAANPTEVNRLARHEGASGAELLQAVRSGRLWLNVTRIDRVDASCRRLIESLYEALSVQIPTFEPTACQGTLLISAPDARVLYHADAPASVLWHVRGRKRVWVYPALDPHYLPSALLEDIVAGARHEFVPYADALDAGAAVFDLEPGQWMAWPQNAPHRVSNLEGVNVSLVTDHVTRASQRRQRVYLANRFLRKRLGVRQPSTREDGALAWAKTVLQRVARKLGLDPVRLHRHVAVDPAAAAASDGVLARRAPEPDARVTT